MEITKLELDQVANGDISILEKFVKEGGDLNTPLPAGDTLWTPLLYFIAAKSIEAVKACISLGGSMLYRTPNEGYTALHVAARFGGIGIIQFLIDSGMDVDITDSIGRNILHFASAFGQIEVAKYLTEKYPQLIHKIDSLGYTPCDYAIEHKHFDIVNELSLKINSIKNENRANEMKKWLEPIGCIQYLGVLLDNGYDMESLSDLGGPTEDDLDKMGIKARMDRKKLSSLYHFPKASSELIPKPKSGEDDEDNNNNEDEEEDDEDSDEESSSSSSSSSDESDSSEDDEEDDEEDEEDSDDEDEEEEEEDSDDSDDSDEDEEDEDDDEDSD